MRTYDARAWLVWLLVGGLLGIVTGNPFYLLLLLLISRVVQFACEPSASGGWRLPFWRVSLMILIFSTLFNLLTAHAGRTVLTTLPANWPLIGGPLTLEAAVYGFLNGLRLVTLLSFFTAFNAIVAVSDLTGLTPRALHELGLVMLIAVTYVPETAGQFRRIRDAQAIRGHRMNGLRAWRPVLIPLLIAGLERALNLSETMVARGYGSTTHVVTPFRARALFLVGLLLSLGGALRLAWAAPDGWLWIILGILVIGWAYYALSRLAPRTRYRPRRWLWTDTVLVGGAMLALLPLLPLPGLGRGALLYSPYPHLTLPPFDLRLGLCLFGLVAPAVLGLMAGRPMEAAG
jgi:energy-coupling factor transport system permease protein